MPEQKGKKQGLWQRLQHTYRLVIMNNETFEEIGSYRLTLLNVYVWICTLVVLVAVFVTLLIFYTPLKNIVPGYSQAEDTRAIYEMNKQLARLEKELDAYELYAENVRKMLVGDVVFPEEEEEMIDIPKDDSLHHADRIMEEEQLRKEIEINELQRLGRRNNQALNFSPNEVPIEQMYFMPPVRGTISAGFMPQRKHYGVDVLAPKNTAVQAIMDGYVITSDWTVETGHTIGIQHDNNILSFYKHNSALLKDVGDFVKAGEAVAIIGNSGTLSSGPHLHFEIWHQGKPLNPEDYVVFE